MHSGLADEAGSVPPTESWLGLLTSRVWFALRNMRIRWGSGGFPDTRSGAGSSPWPRWSPWAREDEDATVTRSGWAGSCARPGEPRFRLEPVLRFCAYARSGARTVDVLTGQVPGVRREPDVSVLLVGTNDVIGVTTPATLTRSSRALLNALVRLVDVGAAVGSEFV